MYNDHCLDIVIIIWGSINFPTVICLPTICYFSRVKPLVKSTAPGSIFSSYTSRSIFPFAFLFICNFYFQIYISKPQKYLVEFDLLLFATINLLQFYLVNLTILGAVTRKGLRTPLTRRVASICSLCAGTVYVVLLGSPTGLITLVLSPREIPTIVVLLHPFLFEEILT